MRKTFDDGSWVEYGPTGNVTRYGDTAGNVYTPDRSAVGDFVDSLLQRATVAVRGSSVSNAPAPIVSTTTSSLNLQALMPLLLVGLGLFFVLKLAKG